MVPAVVEKVTFSTRDSFSFLPLHVPRSRASGTLLRPVQRQHTRTHHQMLAATSFPAVDSSPLIHPGLPCPCIHPRPQRHVGQQWRRHTLLHGHKQFPCVPHTSTGLLRSWHVPHLHRTHPSLHQRAQFLPLPPIPMLFNASPHGRNVQRHVFRFKNPTPTHDHVCPGFRGHVDRGRFQSPIHFNV